MTRWRVGVALAAWLLAGYTSLWVAANTKIGPVVFSIVPEHGIHRGDVVVVAAGAAVATIISVAALRRSGGPAIPAAGRRPGGPGRG